MRCRRVHSRDRSRFTASPYGYVGTLKAVVGGVAYQHCGSTWYQPRYAGTQVNYIVVNPPQ